MLNTLQQIKLGSCIEGRIRYIRLECFTSKMDVVRVIQDEGYFRNGISGLSHSAEMCATPNEISPPFSKVEKTLGTRLVCLVARFLP